MSVLSQFFGGGDKLVPVEVLAVGGGGGGAPGTPPPPAASSGGGAGAVVYNTTFAIVGKSYIITIGAGGAIGSDGSPTTFGGQHINAFGGGGGSISPANMFIGSAAGGRPSFFGPIKSVGSYNFANTADGPGRFGGPGGGGASTGSDYEDGGDGMSSYLIGYPSVFVGGGGGGGRPAAGIGGTGGGGNGGLAATFPFSPIPDQPGTPGTAGSTNTGGGGGGGGLYRLANPPALPPPANYPGLPGGDGAAGGSGVLFIRYPTAFDAATVTGNTPTPAQPGYHVYRWNSGPGTITFN